MRGMAFLAAVAFGLMFAGPASAQQLDRTGEPNYGTLTLAPDWRPNPHEVSMVAGGDYQAANIVSGCTGWVTGQPDFALTFRSEGDVRAFEIRVRSEADVTLIVQGPDGLFTCNDDAEGTNPVVTVSSPLSGQYAIWVGSYSDEDADAVLSFHELR